MALSGERLQDYWQQTNSKDRKQADHETRERLDFLAVLLVLPAIEDALQISFCRE